MSRTPVIVVDRDNPDPAALQRAGQVVRDGGLVAFATETVYGLGADATNVDAIRRIFAAKGRPSDNPLIVHTADAAMARQYARHWPEAAAVLSRLWPGPLTLVVPKGQALPAEVSAGLDTVGLRVPGPAVARALIRAAGRPIAAPSANRSEYISPTRAAHVVSDLGGRIDLVIDSGPTTVGIESTVVDLCAATPAIVRRGPIGASELSACLGAPVVERASAGGPAVSPGQRARHYAPTTETLWVESREALAALSPTDRDVVLVVGGAATRPSDLVLAEPTEAAERLYAMLRECDAAAPARILIVVPPDVPAWQAIRDRLRRATT